MIFSPEQFICIVVLVFILGAYSTIFPKFVGRDLNKMAVYDTVLLTLVLLIVGSQFWGSDYQFDFYLLRLNWFWATLVLYILIEIPFVINYMYKHKITFHDAEK